jgi:hypothetical protein
MKKENDTPASPEKLSSNVRNYFNKDIEDRIAEMNIKQMSNLLKGIVDSETWIALLKYTETRMAPLDAILRTSDPTKSAHQISWAQGCMAGLCDIENYVIDLNSPEKTEEPVSNANNKPEGVIISGK